MSPRKNKNGKQKNNEDGFEENPFHRNLSTTTIEPSIAVVSKAPTLIKNGTF